MHALKYTNKDRERFADYFEQKPEKRKADRPKKRKRKYKKSKKNKKKQQKKNNNVPKARRRLFEDKFDGEVATDKKPTRVNWDLEPKFSYRDRLTTSWITQTDLWRVGEKFGRFCLRCGINRNVLNNYIAKIKSGAVQKAGSVKCGRKSMLSESVMRHLCEG